jgi:hypothetical protein
MIDNKTGNVVLRNNGAGWPIQCCHGKTMGITNYECVTIQHAKRVCHITLSPVACLTVPHTTLSPVACLTVPHTSTLSHKR